MQIPPDTARYRTRVTRLRYRTAPVPHHYGMVSQGQSCAYRYRTIPHDTDTARCRYRTMPIPHDADTDADTARCRTRAQHYGMVSQGQSCAHRYRTIPHYTSANGQGFTGRTPGSPISESMGYHGEFHVGTLPNQLILTYL